MLRVYSHNLADLISLNSEGKLNVPSNPIIPFIEGDGIGKDIWKSTVRVLDAAVKKSYGSDKRVSWMEVYAGEKSNEVYGENTWLPQETLDIIDAYTTNNEFSYTPLNNLT
mgnify:CR=1 FL=1